MQISYFAIIYWCVRLDAESPMVFVDFRDESCGGPIPGDQRSCLCLRCRREIGFWRRRFLRFGLLRSDGSEGTIGVNAVNCVVETLDGGRGKPRRELEDAGRQVVVAPERNETLKLIDGTWLAETDFTHHHFHVRLHALCKA